MTSRAIRIAAGALLALAAPACAWELTSPESDRAACANPAPLHGQKSSAPGFIVVYREGTRAAPVTDRLAKKYGFTPRFVYEHALQGFSAELSETALAGVRCEPEVKYVEHDAPVGLGII